MANTFEEIDEAHRTGWYKHFRPCDPAALNEAAEHDGPMTAEEKADADSLLRQFEEALIKIARENGL